ncbi:MAG: hypothetical protein AAFS10_19500, partial [Myxococcota bacterium]
MNRQLLTGRIALGLGLVMAVYALLGIGGIYLKMQSGGLDAVFFKMQYPTEVLAYMGIVTIIAAGSMLLGLVLQGLG